MKILKIIFDSIDACFRFFDAYILHFLILGLGAFGVYLLGEGGYRLAYAVHDTVAVLLLTCGIFGLLVAIVFALLLTKKPDSSESEDD